MRAKYWKVVHMTVSVWKQCYMYIIYSSISDMIQLISVHLLLMVSSMIQSMQNAKIGERADILVPLLSSILTHLLGLFHKWVYLRLVTKCITLFQGCLSLVQISGRQPDRRRVVHHQRCCMAIVFHNLLWGLCLTSWLQSKRNKNIVLSSFHDIAFGSTT